MSAGYVYILTNPAMPMIVKIGRTSRTPEQRCDELWQTGVPEPFEVFEAVFSPDSVELEREMHETFRGARVSTSREFFRISPCEALEELDFLHLQQITKAVRKFVPNHLVVPEEVAVNLRDLSEVSSSLGISIAEIVQAIPKVDPGALSAAVASMRSDGDADG